MVFYRNAMVCFGSYSVTNLQLTRSFQARKLFFYEIEHQAINKHTVTYLPTINKSPTQMDTIQEILCQVKEKAEAFDLKETDLALDHAIYCKAVEVVMSKTP